MNPSESLEAQKTIEEFMTGESEWEKAELAVFWDEIAQHLPKCMERNALGDEKIFHAFATAYPKMKKHLLSSRDTYWKERVRKEVEGMKKKVYFPDEYKNENPNFLKALETEQRKNDIWNQALDTLLDNLK